MSREEKPIIEINHILFDMHIFEITDMTLQFMETFIQSERKSIEQSSIVVQKKESISPLNYDGMEELISPKRTGESITPKKKTDIHEKQCRRCNKTKPVIDFNKNKKDKSGYQTYCRECSSIINKEWKKKHNNIPDGQRLFQGPKPSAKKPFQWTPQNDQIIMDNFKEHGVSGIYDKSLLPGFTLTEIRHRCQELHLIDSFGNTIEERGGGELNDNV